MSGFYDILLRALLNAVLAVMIHLLSNSVWEREKLFKRPPDRKIELILIIIILVIVFLVVHVQFPTPALPSGIDNESTDTTKSLWNNEGVTLYRLGNYTGAIWYYDKAIEMDSGYTLALNNKDIALKALHRDAEAEKALAKAPGAR